MKSQKPKKQIMKLSTSIPIVALLLAASMFSCNKEMDSSSYPNGSSVLKSSAQSAVTSPGLKSAEILPQEGTLKGLDLGIAGDFAILSKTGVTDVYKSSVVGDVGSSPITGAAVLVSCSEVVGTIYTVDAAYTDAAGRVNPDFLNLGAGNIGGKTLTPGLYKWTTALIIPTDITISGSPTDVWIFQVAGTLNMSSAVNITLEGGALAKNIYWQTSGAVTLGTTSHFEGIILSQTGINMKTGATINGRMLAQTAVTLQMNAVTQP